MDIRQHAQIHMSLRNKILGSGLGPLDPGGPWHLSNLVQWVLRHCSTAKLMLRLAPHYVNKFAECPVTCAGKSVVNIA